MPKTTVDEVQRALGCSHASASTRVAAARKELWGVDWIENAVRQHLRVHRRADRIKLRKLLDVSKTQFSDAIKNLTQQERDALTQRWDTFEDFRRALPEILRHVRETGLSTQKELVERLALSQKAAAAIEAALEADPGDLFETTLRFFDPDRVSYDAQKEFRGVQAKPGDYETYLRETGYPGSELTGYYFERYIELWRLRRRGCYRSRFGVKPLPPGGLACEFRNWAKIADEEENEELDDD